MKVSRECYRHIASGNAARSQRDWAVAAHFFRESLKLRPDLVHIHVQLGHAYGELAQFDDAEAAYTAAIDLAPHSRDAAFHLAHLLRRRGAFDEAARLYGHLVLLNREDAEASYELRETLARSGTDAARAMAASFLEQLFPGSVAELATTADAADFRVVYDVTDLITFSSRFRRPTGIQRVQLELVLNMLQPDPAADGVGICHFSPARGGWVAVPHELLRLVSALALATAQSEAGQWERARDELHLRMLAAPAMNFRQGATLVSLGSSWPQPNYLLYVRDLRRQRQVRYMPMVYDLIPILMPEAFADRLVREFVEWLSAVFDHADHFLAISQSTKRDLLAASKTLGVDLDERSVTVVPLDAAFKSPPRQTGKALLPPGLQNKSFCLFVSTIEPRKGHQIAFDAWQLLPGRLKPEEIPMLVCVGNSGWRNDTISAALERDASLRDRVVILHDVGDEELAELYRSSRFTIYPSLYEGWGLPVTEALSHGKIVVTTTAAALPEAGGQYARYIPPGDAPALADAVEELIAHPTRRKAWEARIAKEFRPRSWKVIAEQIADAAIALQRNAHPSLPTVPVIEPGVFYWFGTSGSIRLRRQDDRGHDLRSGLGWHPPEPGGCRVRPGGGDLSFRSSEPRSAANRPRVQLRLIGAPFPCSYAIEGGATAVGGVLAAGERLTVSVEPKPATDGTIDLLFRSGAVEDGVGCEVPTILLEGLAVR